MTTVLMAIDETPESKRASEVAVECFGPDADYLAIYVDEERPTATMWGPGVAWGGVYAYPGLMYPYAAGGPSRYADEPATGTLDAAQAQAERLTTEAGVPAEALGDIGDPATAIADAARAHNADVIVVGSHSRGWFDKLLHGSTRDNLIEATDLPVMIVPAADGD